jgi:hypothetical protein
MKSLRGPEFVIAAVVLAIFLAVGVLDFSTPRQEAQSFDSFSSFDYQRGGYRAWYEMLADEGVRVTRYQRRPAYLDDSVATYVVANSAFASLLRQELGQGNSLLSAADLEALEKWVKGGGHLIWLGRQEPATALFRIPVTAKSKAPLGLPALKDVGPLKDAARPVAPSPLTAGVSRVLGASRTRIPFGADPSLTPEVSDAAGTVVGWYPLGKGSVVVVTDESLFENGRLDQADNARLAYDIATFGLRPGETVAFDEWSHGYQSGDTWWSILPQQWRLSFGIIAGALVLLLLGATWRFGPALPLPENTERTSAEYLTSVAGLLARGDATRKAVGDLAQLALRAAARSVGLPENAAAASIAARLRGREAGQQRADDLLTLERIAAYEHPTPAELVKAAQLAVSLRKEFSSDGFQHIGPRRSAARRTA